MKAEESIEIADLQVRFKAYWSTIHAESEEEEEITEDEEVRDISVKPCTNILFRFKLWKFLPYYLLA